MRVAITIIFEGLHHLTHKGFTEFMVKNFDHWIIIEGASNNGGSTYWCRSIPGSHRSQDGTVEFINELAVRHNHVHVYSHHKHYASKDEQFNKGIAILKTLTDKCYLWQVDADEHWSAEDLVAAERRLWRSVCTVASFQFNHFVKQDVIAVGDWGSGRVNRLWKWKGKFFQTHEPAIMTGQSAPLELPQKFDHYSLVFDKDVRHKAKIYRGHEDIYKNWLRLDDETYPCHVSKLFGNKTPVGRSDSYLHKIPSPCANAQNQKVKEVADLS